MDLSHLSHRFGTGGFDGSLNVPTDPEEARELASRLRDAAYLGGPWHDRYAAGSSPIVMQNGEPPRIAIEKRLELDQQLLRARTLDSNLIGSESRYQAARLDYVVADRLFSALACEGVLFN